MPFDPKVVDVEIVAGGSHDGRSAGVVSTHEMPADPITGAPMLFDEYAEADKACTRYVGEVLNRNFPGYLAWWRIEACARYLKGVKISMPVFLGPNVCWYIRGKDLDDAQIRRAGGAILEMLKLSRRRAKVAELVAARPVNGPREAKRLLAANSR